MNPTFSLPRFISLLNKNLIENYAKYLLSIGIIIGSTGCIFYFIFNRSGGLGDEKFQLLFQKIVLCLGMILGGSILTSSIFSDYGEKNKAIAQILIPASQAEKFLVPWVITIKLFLILLISFYYLTLWILVQIKGVPDFHYFNIFSEAGLKILSSYLLFQSLYFLGSIYFKKHPFIITSLALLIIPLIISYANWLFLQGIIGRGISSSSPFGELAIHHGDLVEITRIETTTVEKLLVFFVLVLIFWFATFFRLKEKEV